MGHGILVSVNSTKLVDSSVWLALLSTGNTDWPVWFKLPPPPDLQIDEVNSSTSIRVKLHTYAG